MPSAQSGTGPDDGAEEIGEIGDAQVCYRRPWLGRFHRLFGIGNGTM
jgi:hypothetical protein